MTNKRKQLKDDLRIIQDLKDSLVIMQVAFPRTWHDPKHKAANFVQLQALLRRLALCEKRAADLGKELSEQVKLNLKRMSVEKF